MTVTIQEVEAIKKTLTADYHHFPGTRYVVAILKSPVGYVWGHGTSSCLPTTTFDLEIGKKMALKNATLVAEDNIWDKLGFLSYEKTKNNAN